VTVVYSDYMEDTRAWLRAHPDLNPLHGGRVFFRLPNQRPASPFQRLYRVGGGPTDSYVPQLQIRLALETWGVKDSDYPAVRQLVTACESAFFLVENEVSGGTLLESGQITSSVDSPDPDTGWPRLVSDVLLTCRAAAPIPL
jgi:hypothetical protein